MRRCWMPHKDGWGEHSLSYVVWGQNEAARTAVCVHGLTRNGRDFDELARCLAGAGWRVIALDVIGRGHSSWLSDPLGYALPVYCDHALALLDALEVKQVDWIGTSMGGLMAFVLAGHNRLRSLVLNDIGPFVRRDALESIRSYLSRQPDFATRDDVAHYVRTIHAGFGPLSDAQWRHLADHSVRSENGRFHLRYDPAIADAFLAIQSDIDLWDLWAQVSCPALIVHGSESQMLQETTVKRMCVGHARAESLTIDSVGHAPALMDPAQTEAILGFLHRQ